MPSSTEILEGLAAIANAWRGLAIAWHAAVAAFLLGLLAGWRPSQRAVGVLLLLPSVSVSALAWASGNPFNGAAFAALTLVWGGLAMRLPTERVRVSSRVCMLPGLVLLAFGSVYPHFLHSGSWLSYLYAAPLGLLPCPTLSAMTGVALIVKPSDSRWWWRLLSAAGILYGLVGVFRLGVGIDVVLLAGALWAGITAGRVEAIRPVLEATLPR